MIYKDLFKIKINGEDYTENNEFLPKHLFTMQEMRNIYVQHLADKFEIEYEPVLMDDMFTPEEIYGDNEGESEDYED